MNIAYAPQLPVTFVVLIPENRVYLLMKNADVFMECLRWIYPQPTMGLTHFTGEMLMASTGQYVLQR